jgi:hypothetical protein
MFLLAHQIGSGLELDGSSRSGAGIEKKLFYLEQSTAELQCIQRLYSEQERTVDGSREDLESCGYSESG